MCIVLRDPFLPLLLHISVSPRGDSIIRFELGGADTRRYSAISLVVVSLFVTRVGIVSFSASFARAGLPIFVHKIFLASLWRFHEIPDKDVARGSRRYERE